MQRIAVIGGGLVGSLLASFMKKAGYEVDVYEKRADLRVKVVDSGRSINLALSSRGWNALEKIGLSETVKQIAIPMRGRCMHAKDGKQTFQPYGKENEAIYSVSRIELTKLLLIHAEKAGVEFFFNHQFEDYNVASGKLQFTGKRPRNRIYDQVFGADGAFSGVRKKIGQLHKVDVSLEYLEHGYVELSIPAGPDGQHQIEPNALHIWPRGNYMFIALPNVDGSFTCTLFMPFSGKVSFEALWKERSIVDFFKAEFPDALDLMPTLEEDFYRHQPSSLVTVKCFPWNYKNKMLLLGDAAHAIVPFYGQGMNAGFEDCVAFFEAMEAGQHAPYDVMEKFASKRKPNTDAISELSRENYTVMRQRTQSPHFLLQKKIEAWLHEQYPDLWIPLYTQVTFSHIPYKEALSNGKKQQVIMDRVLQIPGIENWENPEIKSQIVNTIETELVC